MQGQQDSIQELNKHRTTTKREGCQAASQVMACRVNEINAEIRLNSFFLNLKKRKRKKERKNGFNSNYLNSVCQPKLWEHTPG